MKRLLLLFGMVACWVSGQAQFTVTTMPPLVNNNGSSGITFEVESTAPILITDIKNLFNSGSISAEVWYRIGGVQHIAGSAPSVTSANGWVQHFTGTVSGNGSTPVSITNWTNLTIPANTRVGIAIMGGLSYQTWTSTSQDTFSNGTLTIYTGQNIGYGGGNPSWPNHPREFLGSVTYIPSAPCTSPPTAGTAQSDNSIVCSGNEVKLSLLGATFGTGLQYQWQSSPDGSTYTDLLNDTSSTAKVYPTDTTWYRAILTCGTGKDTSTAVVVYTIGTSLSGTYTLNSAQATSGTNFQSFSDLATALTCGGITGPVTVNAVAGSGPYYEGVEFGSISGSSSINTVTINGNGVMLVDSGTTTSNYAAILLNGTDHLTLDSINITPVGTTNRVGIQFMNEADSNTVRHCKVTMDITATSSTLVALAFSGSATSSTTSGNNGNYNLIEGNTFIGGYYCVRLYGGGTTLPIVGNHIINNTVQDYYAYGIYSYYNEQSIIRGNDIHRMNRGAVTTNYGIYCYYTTNNAEISSNWIHDAFTQATGSTSSMYGILLSSCDNTTGQEGLLANNLITDNNNGGYHYNLYNSSSDGWKIYHNTVVDDDVNAPVTSTTTTTYGFYLTSASNVDFRNNLVFVNRGGAGPVYNVYLSSATSLTMNHNAYYAPMAGTGNKYFGYYSGAVASFSAWQAVNGGAYDQNSAEGDPFFVDAANGDYTPTAAYFNNIGANLQSIVGTDFSGASRSTTPDPGALEFTPPPGPDMAVSHIFTVGSSCGSSTDILVQVLNQGTDTVTAFTVNYTINGVSQTAIPVSGVYATGVYDTISISGIPISGSASTSVVVTLSGISPGTDTDAGNNTDSIHLRAGLSGTYTLNATLPASTTNFISFSDLSAALSTYGVCGPVVVNVGGSSAYTEQFILGEITGASSVNTITINGNGNTLEFLATNSSERGTVILNGADWVTLDSLNINALGSTSSQYGFGVSFTNNADHNTLRHCTITVDATVASSNFAGVTISGSAGAATGGGFAGNYNLIEGNTISGGYYGITSYGASTDSLNGNRMIGNEVKDFYYYGIYGYYNDHIVIDGNEVHRPSRTSVSTFYGIYQYYTTSAHITNNRVHDPFPLDPTSTSTCYGIYAYQFNGTASDSALLGNNLIYNMEHDGTMYVFAPYYISYANVVHNTIVVDDPNVNTTSSYSTYVYYNPGTITNSNVANNLVYVNRNTLGTTYMVYMASVSSSTVDHNAYYNPGNYSYNFGYYGGAVGSFSDWKTTTGLEAHSVFGNPYFVNLPNDDYTPQSGQMDGLGLDFSGILPTDIYGVSRGAHPDAGAIEFNAAPCTGLSSLGLTNVTSSSGTVVWSGNATNVDIIWGPTGFLQASLTGDTVHVLAGDTSGVIASLASNTCYDYYVKQICTSSLPGAPPLMGPYSLCTECAGGGLSGTYTVGGTPGPSNFATLDSVAAALNGCGLAGPVVFNLQGGTHNAITLGAIDGSSAVNTITFNGSASFGDSIVATSQTAAVELDGTSHISFNDIMMVNTSGNYVVWMHNAAEYVNISDCYLLGSGTSTSSLTAVVAATASATSVSSTGVSAHHVTIDGCTISGNYYGVTFYGPGSTGQVGDIKITNNNLANQYYYGIRMYYCDSVEISGNTIPGFRYSSAYGIYSYYSNNMEITSNAIYGAGTYGLYFYYSNYSATAGSISHVVNNMIQANGTAGIYAYGDNNTKFYHNSISGGTTYGFYSSGPVSTNYDNVDIRNNIINMTGTGSAFYIGTVPTSLILDYNLYNSGGDIGNVNGTTYATLAAWQTAYSSWNQHSVQSAPGFISTSDFHIIGAAPNDLGDNSVGVTVDIDGDTRPASGATAVDIGADEYTPSSCIPAGNFMVSSVTNTSAVLHWDSISGAQSYLIQYGVNGFTLGQGTTVSSTSDSIVISGLPQNNLLYQAYIRVNCGAGDSSIWAGPVPIKTKPTLCTDHFDAYSTGLIQGQSTLFTGWNGVGGDGAISTTRSVSGTKSLHVYDSGPSTFTDIVAVFDVINSGVWSVNFNMYIPNNKAGYFNLQQNYVGGGIGNLWGAEIYFRASGTAEVKIGSGLTQVGTFNYTHGQWMNVATVIDLTNDSIWIELNNSTTNVGWKYSDANPGNPLQFNGINLYSGIVAGSGESADYYVDDFCVSPYVPPMCPAPSNLASSSTGCDSTIISWDAASSANYSVVEYGPQGFTPGSGAGTLLGFVQSPVTLTGLTPNTTYSFYVADTCNGDTSSIAGPFNFTTSPAPVAHASFTHSSSFVGNTQVITFNASGSSNADSYSWDFGNGNTGTGVNPPAETYNLPNKAVSVKLTVTNSCGSTDDTTIVINTRIGLEEPEFGKTLTIYPNPSEGVFNISFNKPSGGKLLLEVLDASGRRVFVDDMGSFGGSYSGTINLKDYSKGVYILRINSDIGVVVRRLNRM